MAHITFSVDQCDPQPEQNEETGYPDMLVGDESGGDSPGDFGDGRGDHLEQAIDEIFLLRLPRQESDQALCKQCHGSNFDQRFQRADDKKFG